MRAKPAAPVRASSQRDGGAHSPLCSEFAKVKGASTMSLPRFERRLCRRNPFLLGEGLGGGRRGPLPLLSALVGDPVDRPRVVVGDQERAVLHLLRVNGPAPDVL